jgi:hypothetical protein
MRARHRSLFALVAMIAVFLQTFIVQTHVEGLNGLQSAAAIAHANGSPAPLAHVETGSRDTQSACPICQAMATAGTTVLTSGQSLLTAHGVIAHEARLPIRVVAVRPAHAWRSRAPPFSL